MLTPSAKPVPEASFAVKCEVWTVRYKHMERGGEWSKYHAGLSLHSVLSAGTGDARLENRTERGLRVVGIEPSKQNDKNSLVMLQFRPERVERLVWMRCALINDATVAAR
jgi:hypothetical protein